MESAIVVPKTRRVFPKVLFAFAVFAVFVSILALGAEIGAPALPPGVNPPPALRSLDGWVLIVRFVVTLAVLGASLWVIVSKRYPPADRKWAYGAVGGIMAFWLAAGGLGK